MGKPVYLKGKSHYLNPYFLDTGANLEEGSDVRNKIERTEGIYTTRVLLPFTSRDDAEEHLNSIGIPTDNMFGNLLKKDKDTGNIFYKIVRPHMEPNFEEPLLGPPEVVDQEGQAWDQSVGIGNNSDCTFKLDVWKGNKATKIRWEAVRVDELVPYESNQENF